MTTLQLRDAIYRKLHLEARKTAQEDWPWPTGPAERDRYVQGMKDAATIVLQVYMQRGTRPAKKKRGR